MGNAMSNRKATQLIGGMGNPNGLRCPTHGLLLVDIRGAGHTHPDGTEHGYFTVACPHMTYTGQGTSGFDRCSYERSVNAPCPEDSA